MTESSFQKEASLGQALRLNEACNRFELAWKAGMRPRIEEFLGDCPEPERFALVRELIALEIDYRRRAGEQPQLDEYHARFPALVGSLTPTITDLTGAPMPEAVNLPAIPGYEILQELGRGGMGVVYWAWQTGLNRPVALKMILAGPQAGPAELARFHTEAEAVARLQHLHIVQIHDVGQYEGRPYLVLEYVDGSNLARELNGTPLPAHRAAEVAALLARAIHYAHQQGIVHRDLKPANVLLTREGLPKITDFGLAKILVGGGETLTQSGAILGTPSYMAPEQAAGHAKAIGPAADVYALGAILYEMLTGRPPFKAQTPLETLQQVQSQEPVSPSRLQPKLPRDLATICLKCLEKEPGRRFASAEALAADLQNYLAGEPIQARPVGSLERLWRWCRRKPALASLAGSVCLLLIVLALGASVAAWWLRQERNTALDNWKRADEAEMRRRAELGQSYQNEARARRFGHQVGQRLASLERLGEAAQIARSLNLSPEQLQEKLLELRNEAIACLALPDVREVRSWPAPYAGSPTVVDARLERYAQTDPQGSIHIRRTAADAELLILPGPENPPKAFSCLFSPDGRLLAACYELPPSNPRLVLWDLPARKKIVEQPLSMYRADFAFSPDSHWFAIQSEGEVAICLVNCTTGKVRPDFGRGLRAYQLAFHPDGRRLAFTSDALPIVGILDLGSGKLLATLPQAEVIHDVAWSPDGRLLAASGDHEVYLWDVVQQRRKAVLSGHQVGGCRLLFSSTGDLLASYNSDGTTSLWEVASGQQLLRVRGCVLGFGPGDTQLVISDRRDWAIQNLGDAELAVSSRYTLSILDLVKGRALTTWHRAATTVDFSPDGRLLAAAGAAGVGLWDAWSGRAVGDLHLDHCETAAFHPRGQNLVTYGKTSNLLLWPLRGGPPGPRPVLDVGPPQIVQTGLPKHHWQRACWSRDGKWLAGINPRNHMEQAFLLNAQRPTEIRTLGNLPSIATVAISADGQWVAAGTWDESRVRLWQSDKPAVVKDFPGCGNAAFSPDGKWLVTAGPFDYRCWRMASWEPTRRWPREHVDWLGSNPLAFAPNSAMLALACRSQEVDLVDPKSGKIFARLVTPTPALITGMCFNPDGSCLAVAKANQEVDLWDLRLIRQELAPLGLDWIQDAFPPSKVPRHVEPVQVHVVEAAARDPAQAWRGYWRFRGIGHQHRNLFSEPEWAEAVIDFTEALKILPPNAPAHDRAELLQRRADSYAQLEVYEAARADWEETVALEPTNAAACHDLAHLYVAGPPRLRDPARALLLARNAVELGPKQTAYRTTLALAYYRLGQYALGVAALEQGPNARPGEPAAADLFVRAMCHARQGQPAKARDCYDRAVRAMRERHGKFSATARKALESYRAEADTVLRPPP